MRRTKIVCTLGPASGSPEVMKQMLEAGMNVARLNFSHGTHAEQKQKLDAFRAVRDQLGFSAAVMLDTKGPEIRLRDFARGEEILAEGQEFTLTSKVISGTSTEASVTYAGFAGELQPGDSVLIDDGKVHLKVISIESGSGAGQDCSGANQGGSVKCKVITGGKVSNHKGVNLPDKDLAMEYLSEQDKKDILFGVENDVDYIAASFVRRGQDVVDIRNLIESAGADESRIKIIAKIENMEGIKNFEEILQLADGIMVARGDMGVEIPFEQLPGIQKRIIRRCMQSGKIVITATQMLESMIDSPVPTRAEITDVANAVFDGTSAVMLSGETAAGKYPIEAVKVMAQIAQQAETDDPRYRSREEVWHEMDSSDTTNAVGHAACTLARDIKASALIAITKTGYTSTMMSKFRPAMQIIAATPEIKTYHQMAAVWGVTPVMTDNEKDPETMIRNCVEIVRDKGMISSGQQVVISAGLPLDVPGNTNLIRVEQV